MSEQRLGDFDSLKGLSRKQAMERCTEVVERQLAGKRIVSARADVVHHDLDHIYGLSEVTLTFDDGTDVTFYAGWCNDGTADLDVVFSDG